MYVTMVLTVGGVIVAGCAMGTAWVALQGMRRWQARYESLESSFASLRRELETVASISVRTGRRVQRVEHEYSDVAERVDVVESRSLGASRPGSGALDQAIDWTRSGGDSEKLSRQFGISHGEADLVTRMHGRKKSA